MKHKLLCLVLCLSMLLGGIALSEGYSDLPEDYGDDDEVVNSGRLELIANTTLPGEWTDEYYQITSDGYYIRENMTTDGIVMTVSRSFLPIYDEVLDTLEPALASYATELSNQIAPVEAFTLTESPDRSTSLAYPAYRATWQSGFNEDLRENHALFILTDTATLVYSIAISADFANVYEDGIDDVFDGLVITFVD